MQRLGKANTIGEDEKGAGGEVESCQYLELFGARKHYGTSVFR